MRKCFWFKSAAIRLDYTRHVMRSMRDGFEPLTFAAFGTRFARRFYLVGECGAMLR